ncbi:YncE family protein [Flavobacterium sp. CS20]|uniref:YncE family protein n=1 Tax=Flavobacterium sp. CS20 TaxID=2775246 RepID=UPI001B39E589|nr:cell surface protein [Flavobacterium sp. CS20]QTY27832.1 cell surface protein [Flavobacterium sp. CS20]
MKTKTTIFIFLTSLIFLSCSSDDDVSNISEPSAKFDEGVFVLNEGGEGDVTYISNDFSRIEQNIFSSINPDETLGQFAQSIFFDDNNRAYIISNGSNLITVVDRFSFEKLGEITTGLDVPRYGLVKDGKAYVTNQASFNASDDDFVAIIDINALEVENIINIGETVEFIKTDGQLIYVQNAAYGFGNKISVINPNNNSVTSQIETNIGLQNIVVYGNFLYALHESGIDQIDLNTLDISSTKTLDNELYGAKNLRIFNDNIYYTYENSVYKTQLSSSTLNNEPLLSYNSSSEFGTMYGFEVNDGFIYISDAKDFVSDGFVEIYDVEGNFIFETNVGLAPNGFYFN